MSEQKELTPRLRFELEGTKPEYQERLAELLHFASAMGDYGDPHGVLAVISSVTGKILEREDGKEQKRLDRPDSIANMEEYYEKYLPEYAKKYPITMRVTKEEERHIRFHRREMLPKENSNG